MNQLYEQFFRYVDRLGTQEWAMVLAGAILIGFLSLRGFGSRSNY